MVFTDRNIPLAESATQESKPGVNACREVGKTTVSAAPETGESSLETGLGACGTHASLPLRMSGRLWAMQENCGEVFARGHDFDGTVLVIEIKSPDEAARVETALNAQIDAERWYTQHGDQL